MLSGAASQIKKQVAPAVVFLKIHENAPQAKSFSLERWARKKMIQGVKLRLDCFASFIKLLVVLVLMLFFGYRRKICSCGSENNIYNRSDKVKQSVWTGMISKSGNNNLLKEVEKDKVGLMLWVTKFGKKWKFGQNWKIGRE